MNTSEQIQLSSTDDEQFWKQHMSSFMVSGINQTAYCRLHHLIYHRFKYWHRKLQSEKQKLPLVAVKLKAAETSTALSNLPILCSLTINAKQQLHIYDVKMVDYILQRYLA